MSLHCSEKTIKRLGETIEQAFARLNEAMAIVEKIDEAGSEYERDIYTQLAGVQAHHIWHSMVKLFRRIAHEIDKETPRGSGAAQRLIEQMMQRTNDRPSILNLHHREMATKLRTFHKDFRTVSDNKHSRSEIVNLIEYMNEDLAPQVLENVRVLTLSSPGGNKLVSLLRPKSRDASMVQLDEVAKRA